MSRLTREVPGRAPASDAVFWVAAPEQRMIPNNASPVPSRSSKPGTLASWLAPDWASGISAPRLMISPMMMG